MRDQKQYVELPDEVVDKLEEILLYLEDGRVYLALSSTKKLLKSKSGFLYRRSHNSAVVHQDCPTTSYFMKCR